MTNQISNVTPIESKQTTPTAKFTIQATLDGFPIVIEGEGRAGDLRLIIDRLKQIGATPPAAQASQPVASTSAGIPRCSVHNTPMKASRKPGSYFCPRQAEDGNGYCPEKA